MNDGGDNSDHNGENRPVGKREALSDLSPTWQTLASGAGRPRPAVDLKRKARQQRWAWGAESLVAAAGAVVGLVLIVQGPALIGIAALIYSLFGAVLAWKTRSINIDLLGRSTRDYLAARRTGLKTKRNHDAGGALMCLAATGFFCFVRGQQATAWSNLDWGILAGLVGAAVCLAIRARRGQRRVMEAERQATIVGHG